MGDVLDVLDFVEGEVEGGKVDEVVQAADVRDEVVVEVEVVKGGGNTGDTLYVLDQVLAEADAGYLLEALETESRDRLDSGVGADDLVGV